MRTPTTSPARFIAPSLALAIAASVPTAAVAGPPGGAVPDAAGSAKPDFDKKHLFVGAQLIGNTTIHSLESTQGLLGGGAGLVLEYVFIPYLKIALEPGWYSAGYRNALVTDEDSNVVDDELNLYVDPDDLITKRGGRGTSRFDTIAVPIVLKGRYPIAFGNKGMFIAPFLSLGGQPEFNLSSNYAVENDETFDFSAGANGVDFKLLGGLGLDFSLGKYGQIGLEGRFLFGVTKSPEMNLVLNSRPNDATESLYPIDFTVPENRWSHMQLLLNYRYGFKLGK